MSIKGLEGVTGAQLAAELQNGAKFVTYQYCFSILILTFKRFSNVYFIRGGENAVVKGLGYTILSLLFGWWGIPWGPIYTIQALWLNLRGGKDVTQEIMASLRSTASKS